MPPPFIHPSTLQGAGTDCPSSSWLATSRIVSRLKTPLSLRMKPVSRIIHTEWGAMDLHLQRPVITCKERGYGTRVTSS